MEFLKKYKNLFLLVLIIGLIFLCIFVFIFFFNSQEAQDDISNEILGEQDTNYYVLMNPTNDVIDYNFAVPATVQGETRALIYSEIPKTKKKNLLKISKLNLETEIIYGTDGEAAINQGAWFYPSSFEDEGEKILLGHRRYWGADDPRSFWNLNQLKKGDEIKYYDDEGRELVYMVKAVGLRTGDDHSILRASKENVLKVISCSTADGSAGSSEKRIVVIAELI